VAHRSGAIAASLHSDILYPLRDASHVEFSHRGIAMAGLPPAAKALAHSGRDAYFPVVCDSRGGGRIADIPARLGSQVRGDPMRRPGLLCEDKTVFTARPDQRLDIGKLGAWRARLRSRLQIERSLLGSGLLHLLVLLALMFVMVEHPPKELGASNPVTVIFEPSPPSSRPDLPRGQAATSAPEEGPQVPPPLGTSQPPAMPAPPVPQQLPQPSEKAAVEPLPPIPPPSVPASPAPPVAVLAPAIPPPPVSSAEPGPVPPPPPPVALALPLPPRPSPPMPIRPRAERSQPALPPLGGSLSSPMNYSFGAATPESPKSRPTGRKNTLDPTLGPEVRDAVGSPPTDIHRPDASIKVSGAQVGTDWIMQLHEWWEQHGYYPNQAAFRGEDGTVKIHVEMDRYGKVLGVELTGRSGSQWLDLAALSVFRGATLPPFPPSTPEGRAELDLTINYILYR
jgi:protein TonB